MDIVLFYTLYCTVCLVLSSKPELNRQRQIKVMNLKFKNFTKKQGYKFSKHFYNRELTLGYTVKHTRLLNSASKTRFIFKLSACVIALNN